MKVLICGGRDFEDISLMRETLQRFEREHGNITHVVSGAQRKRALYKAWIGADWLAIEWAIDREIPFTGIPAKWTFEGKSAGPLRNRRMIGEDGVKWVIPFPGGTGTADMCDVARDIGIPVYMPK